MIRNVLFDIDDTLFPSTEFSNLARKNALAAMIEFGIGIKYSKLEATLKKVIVRKGSNYQKHFDEVCRINKIKKPAKYIAAAIAAYHNTKSSILPYPEVPRLLLRLKELGYRVYAATNGNSIKQWDKLIRLGIALYFDDVFVSEEIGQKKSQIFFKRLLKKLNARPNECVMIGDREDSDIAPAKKVGMFAIRVRRGKHRKGKTCADKDVADLENIAEIIKRMTD